MALRDVLNDLAIDFGLVADRAGRYPRHLVRERRRAFLKASWPRLLVTLCVGFAAAGLTFLLPRWARGFVAGAWLATVIWFLAFLVVQFSGSAQTMMGATAEQWTAQELRSLRRKGWKVMSHAMPTFGDIDHIAVGPGGLIVIETKWRSDLNALDDSAVLRAECRQVRKKARVMRLALQNRLLDTPTLPVIVYWIPGARNKGRPHPFEIDGVTVVSGSVLRHWLESVTDDPAVVVARTAVDSAWETLVDVARNTDRREASEGARVSRAPMRNLIDLATGLLAGLFSFFTASILFRWLKVPFFLPVVVALAATGLVSFRCSRPNASWRVLALGAAAGYCSFLIVIAGVYAYSLL